MLFSTAGQLYVFLWMIGAGLLIALILPATAVLLLCGGVLLLSLALGR